MRTEGMKGLRFGIGALQGMGFQLHFDPHPRCRSYAVVRAASVQTGVWDVTVHAPCACGLMPVRIGDEVLGPAGPVPLNGVCPECFPSGLVGRRHEFNSRFEGERFKVDSEDHRVIGGVVHKGQRFGCKIGRKS